VLLPCVFSTPLAGKKCDCARGSAVDARGYHLSTCKIGGGGITRHDTTLAGPVLAMVRNAGFVARVEITGLVDDSSQRMDLLVYDFNPDGSTATFDLTISHPAATQTTPAAARRALCSCVGPHSCCVTPATTPSLAAAAAKKTGVWARPMQQLGFTFTPLAADCHGALHRGFTELIDACHDKVADGWLGQGRLWSAPSFRSYWTARIVTSIVRGTGDARAWRARRLRSPATHNLPRVYAHGMPPRHHMYAHRLVR
jgi:hypothetical protein